MPSPIAHSVTGYALASLLPLDKLPRDGRWTGLLPIALGMFIGNAPDVDFAGQMLGLTTHRGITHSLGMMVMTSLLATLAARLLIEPKLRQQAARQLLLVCLAIYGSHLALDLITVGGPGMKLLWPLSDRYYGSPVRIFPAVHYELGVLSLGHLRFISFELLYSALILTPLWRREKLAANRRKKPGRT
ncbi:MAG: metal-dependent hydrolase [Cyanobacteria bacterium J06638_6]